MDRMSTEPKPLRRAPRCNAKTRTGQRCRSPAAHGGPKCWIHARGYGPRGEQNGAHRHGNRTQRAKALRKEVRQWARDGEVLVAASLRAFGVKRKRPRRSDIEVEKKLAAMLAAGKVTEAFQTVSELMGRADGAKPGAATAKPAAALRDDDAPPF
jgi:hypothetical protein